MHLVRGRLVDADRVDALQRLDALAGEGGPEDAVDLAGRERLHDRRLVEDDLDDELPHRERPVRVPVFVEAVEHDLLALGPRGEHVGPRAHHSGLGRADVGGVRLGPGLRGDRGGIRTQRVGEDRVWRAERHRHLEIAGRADVLDALVEGREVGAELRVAVAVEAEGDVLGGHVGAVVELDAGAQGDDERRRVGLLPRFGEVRLELPLRAEAQQRLADVRRGGSSC